MKNEIFKYRLLTLAFGIFAFGALGTLATGTSLLRAGATFLVFSFMALVSFNREEELVDRYKKINRAKRRRAKLQVYQGAEKDARVA